MKLESIASRPIASYLGEETNTCLTITSFQVVVESDGWDIYSKNFWLWTRYSETLSGVNDFSNLRAVTFLSNNKNALQKMLTYSKDSGDGWFELGRQC